MACDKLINHFKGLVHPNYKITFSYLMLVASSHADSLDFILFLPQESLPSLQYNKDNLVFVYSDQSSEKVHLKNSTAMCLSINSFH